MTSRSRTTKSELVAIYRLEFYKKQKNWKLGSAKRRTADSKKDIQQSKNKLNETYSIELVDEDQPDLLNVAFCEPESGTATTKTSTTKLVSPDLSQQWLEPVNIWPQTVCTVEAKPNLESHLCPSADSQDVASHNSDSKKSWIQNRLETLMKAAQERGCDVQSESVHLPEIETDICATRPDTLEGNLDENWVPDELQQTTWSEPWLNATELASDVWPTDVDVVDGWNADARQCCRWDNALAVLPCVLESTDVDKSLDSVSEFMRGAHAAPHSSELELDLPSGISAGEVSATSLCRLSARQLSEAVSQHWRLLTRLLKERHRRQNLRSSISLYTDLSLEELPTRDLGPGPRTLGDFVAGSHRAGAPGRGRGRVPRDL